VLTVLTLAPRPLRRSSWWSARVPCSPNRWPVQHRLLLLLLLARWTLLFCSSRMLFGDSGWSSG
jgi:hypothetical protein